MKLSEVLDKYYVMALNSSEIVAFSSPDESNGDQAIAIKWFDSVDSCTHEQFFNDQDIILLDKPEGAFFVKDVDGRDCGFLALDGVPLKHPRRIILDISGGVCQGGSCNFNPAPDIMLVDYDVKDVDPEGVVDLPQGKGEYAEAALGTLTPEYSPEWVNEAFEFVEKLP